MARRGSISSSSVLALGHYRSPVSAAVTVISTAPEFQAGVPHTLFEHEDLAIGWGRRYDVSPDGQRFLMALTKERPGDRASTQMILVQNWFDELKRLVPIR